MRVFERAGILLGFALRVFMTGPMKSTGSIEVGCRTVVAVDVIIPGELVIPVKRVSFLRACASKMAPTSTKVTGGVGYVRRTILTLIDVVDNRFDMV